MKLINSHEDVESGDVLCLLSCEKKFNKLNLNKYNLVVHESDLPEGKGWSPLTWQVIEGKRNIPITLFEANSLIDSGNIEIFLIGKNLNMDYIENLEVKIEKLINRKVTFYLSSKFSSYDPV